MSRLSALAGSNGAFVGGAVVVAVGIAGAGYYVSSVTQDAREATPDVAVPAQVAPAKETPAPEAPAPAPDVVADAETTPPTIDEVRLEDDGLAIVAGRAAPNSTVVIKLDGETNIETQADQSGSFAAVTTIAPTENAQTLTLVQETDEEQVAAVDEIIRRERQREKAVEEIAAMKQDGRWGS